MSAEWDRYGEYAHDVLADYVDSEGTGDYEMVLDLFDCPDEDYAEIAEAEERLTALKVRAANRVALMFEGDLSREFEVRAAREVLDWLADVLRLVPLFRVRPGVAIVDAYANLKKEIEAIVARIPAIPQLPPIGPLPGFPVYQLPHDATPEEIGHAVRTTAERAAMYGRAGIEVGPGPRRDETLRVFRETWYREERPLRPGIVSFSPSVPK